MISKNDPQVRSNVIVDSSSATDRKAARENPLETEQSIPVVERNPDHLHRALHLACQCAKVADELKAADVVVLDLTKITPEFDYFVIATGNSRRQLHAIVEEADNLMASSGSERRGVEGYDSNAWILQDYGDIILHAFDPKNRELYDLERLWGDAERIDWQAVLAAEQVK